MFRIFLQTYYNKLLLFGDKIQWHYWKEFHNITFFLKDKQTFRVGNGQAWLRPVTFWSLVVSGPFWEAFGRKECFRSKSAYNSAPCVFIIHINILLLKFAFNLKYWHSSGSITIRKPIQLLFHFVDVNGNPAELVVI